MATGLQMFDALKLASRDFPPGCPFRLNRFDAEDLCKLTAAELETRGFSPETAVRVSAELQQTGDPTALGAELGLEFVIDPGMRDIIPFEGLRRAGGILADDPQSLEDILDELDRIRHPERHAI